MFSKISLQTELSPAYKGIQNAWSDRSYKATGLVVETTEKTNNTLRGATEEAVNKITLAKEQVIGSVTGTAEQAKTSINEIVHTTDNLTSSLANTLQTELSHTIHNWLATHPLISWGLHHPLQILGIVLLVIFLLRGIFKLTDKLIVDALELVLKLPFKLSIFFLRKGKINNTKEAGADVGQSLELASSAQEEELVSILQKLEAMNQEQSQLLQRVRTILDSQDCSLPQVTETRFPSLTVRGSKRQ
jgi:hypothetical protein